MKKLLFASLTLLVISCNREDLPAPVTPVQPAAVHENYMVVNGDNHTNDTIRFTVTMQGDVHGDTVDIITQNSPVICMRLWTIPLYVGSSDSLFSSNNNLSITYVSNIAYAVDGAVVTITSVGSSGGYLEGYYSGNFKKLSAPYTTISVAGKFYVTRN